MLLLKRLAVFAVCCVTAFPVLTCPDAAQAAPQSGAEHDDAHATGNAHGGDHASPDPIVVDPDLAIFTAIIFLVLLAVLWKFAWGPIAAGLERREHNIAENIAAAQRAGDEARLMLADYERKLAGAADQVRELLDEARRDAEHTRTQILAEAKTSAQAERDRSLREISIATDGALKQLAEASANAAVDLAGKIVQTQLSPADHERLVQEAMTRFPQAQPSQN